MGEVKIGVKKVKIKKIMIVHQTQVEGWEPVNPHTCSADSAK